jgi:hypothetical protein
VLIVIVGGSGVTGGGTRGSAGAAIWLADWPVATVPTEALILSLMPELAVDKVGPATGAFGFGGASV